MAMEKSDEVHEGYEKYEKGDEVHEEEKGHEGVKGCERQRSKSQSNERNQGAHCRGAQESDLTKNKQGKVVSRKSRAAGLRAYQKNGLAKFGKAVQAARKGPGTSEKGPISLQKIGGHLILYRYISVHRTLCFSVAKTVARACSTHIQS